VPGGGIGESIEDRGLAATCHVETAEGPVRMSETPNKGFAVLTRLPSGQLGFRQLIKLVTRGPVPLVRVVLSTGHEVLAARGHPFYRSGMEAVAAERLAPGDLLETAFRYPEGYTPPDLPDAGPSDPIRVMRVEAAGEGEVMTGTVRDTHALFITAGVLCGE
jgi:hypothetical protein